jgi:hypothetical protein
LSLGVPAIERCGYMTLQMIVMRLRAQADYLKCESADVDKDSFRDLAYAHSYQLEGLQLLITHLDADWRRDSLFETEVAEAAE